MKYSRLLASAAVIGVVAATSVALSGPAARAADQAAASSVSRTISVTGTGRSDVAPDIAILSLGVTSSGATGREALDANTKAMSAVMDGLKTLGFGDGDIQTAGLSLNSNMDYSSNPPRPAGFQAINGVTLKVRDIQKLGEILDTTVTNGANLINSLTFDVADKAAALNEARVQAVKDARAKAEIMAGAAGATVGRVVAISEGYVSSPAPISTQAIRAEAAAPVPIAAGQVGLEVQVSVVFELN